MQVAFWLAAVAVLDTLRGLSGDLHGVLDLVVPSLAWSAVGYSVSSALVAIGKRARIVERALPVTAALAVVGIACAAVAAVAAIDAISRLLGGSIAARDLPGLAILDAIVFAVWSTAALMVAQVERAHAAERRELVAVSAATEARLRMLRHQLNPHFLFNSLNSLAATIDEDRDRAQRLVLDLSSLLRDALADDSDAGTLGDELDRIERYLRIEQARFEDRLRVRIAVADELRGVACLPFLLQPLVENAIKHGATGALAEVHLAATRGDGRVQIQVSNLASPVTVRGAGIGLANVRERLVARYGPAHRLEQRHRPDGWVEVELSWPCEVPA